jgi:hypothetical protein
MRSSSSCVDAFALHNAFELNYFFAGDNPGIGSSAVGP